PGWRLDHGQCTLCGDHRNRYHIHERRTTPLSLRHRVTHVPRRGGEVVQVRKPVTPLSILDLVRVTQDAGPAQALANARELASHAESLGFRRYWVAEHHNAPSIASAATSIVIAHIAAGTRHIRVGAGGIMLPNHS